jgi:RNA polymerase sigma factor (sigma-70 family)
MVSELTEGWAIEEGGRSKDRLAQLAATFEAEYEGLLRFAFLVAGNRGEAEDLVQEAFIRIYQTGDRVDSARLVPYARRTIVNLNRSIWRRIAVRRAHAQGQARLQEGFDLSAAHDVRAALMALRPGERACLALRFYEGLEDREIAETLGITLSAVKKRMQRGLLRVRTLIGEDESS